MGSNHIELVRSRCDVLVCLPAKFEDPANESGITFNQLVAFEFGGRSILQSCKSPNSLSISVSFISLHTHTSPTLISHGCQMLDDVQVKNSQQLQVLSFSAHICCSSSHSTLQLIRKRLNKVDQEETLDEML